MCTFALFGFPGWRTGFVCCGWAATSYRALCPLLPRPHTLTPAHHRQISLLPACLYLCQRWSEGTPEAREGIGDLRKNKKGFEQAASEQDLLLLSSAE
ncbi:hypothetical protein F5B22DRAFT_279683 [Xylaria bambusicola]|uniref:uncharacterized protein n=1 Tax=Xylaria bambusicola TaxID=326684 RepID=UPI0020074745|nr:uncharacterized protein F5B22DRAFT_279683 [Xylaria bambusicola]KAI0513204.1 hypothetical protein F5B22DRAFT_279683 [Xylaria bambusicola]